MTEKEPILSFTSRGVMKHYPDGRNEFIRVTDPRYAGILEERGYPFPASAKRILHERETIEQRRREAEKREAERLSRLRRELSADYPLLVEFEF